MSVQNNQILYSCNKCGSKYDPSASDGLCPYCRTSNFDAVNISRNNYKRNQIRKKQIRKAIFRLSVLVVIFIVLIVGVSSLVSSILKGNESLIYKTAEFSDTPLFYTDSDGKVFYLDRSSESLLIGKGSVTGLRASADGKDIFFVFEGTLDLDSLNDDSSYLLHINSDNKLETVAESSFGEIRFIAGVDCSYIYYIINETIGTYQSSSRLYLYDEAKDESMRISEYSSVGDYSNFRVSANGRYLLYKAEDDGGTKLMRFSVKDGTSENLGIKNAEPVSIDNKGKYYSYIKSGIGICDFYVESSVSDREKVSLETSIIDRIIISSDYRDFIIETGNLTYLKSAGKEAIAIAAATNSGIGNRINYIVSYNPYEERETSKVTAIAYSLKDDFFPYFYISTNTDGTKNLVVCEKDGVKKNLFEEDFEDFVTNGTIAAFISNDALYTVSADTRNSTVSLKSENFSRYTLHSLSDNGKYIFYNDTDGNLYRIPYDYTGADCIKVAVDASPYISSADGKKAVYITDGTLNYRKDNQTTRLSDSINSNATFVTPDCKKVYYLASSEASKVDNSFSLYVYTGKNPKLIADNIVYLNAYPSMSASFSPVPYSSYIAPEITTIDDEIDSLESENDKVALSSDEN